MGLFQRLTDARQQKRREWAHQITQELGNWFKASAICSDYENVFAQVRPYINKMIEVQPYGVGRNGATLDRSRTPELNALYEPNDEMSWMDFFSTMFATYLTEQQLYVRVHRKANGSVYGYSILPPTSLRVDTFGIKRWEIATADGIETYYEDEVMTIRYSRNPRDLSQGVSPASAVRNYAIIDDLLAQFERALLENGAIPASLTFIRASSQEKYLDQRRELETGLKGASNRNKTIYVWRQFNPGTGEEKDSIEVKPIQGPNTTLALKDIVAVVNDRLNKSFGVSNFTMGDDSSAKYDNAELSDQRFIRDNVKPALKLFWNQFQFGLDRITGGLGYAIQFTIDEPELTERKKVIAETNEKTVKNIKELVQAGSKPGAAVKALGLTEKWLPVATGIYNRALADRQSQIALAGASAESAKTKKDALPGNNSLHEDPHSHGQCYHDHEHTADQFQPFTDAEQIEKQIFDRLIAIAEAVFEENPNFDLLKVQEEIFDLLEAEANRGGEAALEAIGQLADDEVEAAIQAIIDRGDIQISEALGQRLRARTNTLVTGYDKKAREVMRAVLETAEPLTAEEIRKRLKEALPDGKAATIARNEVVYAFKSGRLELDERTAERFNLKLELTWHATNDSTTCDTCAAMDGQKTILGGKYAESVTIPAGTTLLNGNTLDETRTFAWAQDQWNDDGRIPNAHVNCRCYFDEKLITEAE